MLRRINKINTEENYLFTYLLYWRRNWNDFCRFLFRVRFDMWTSKKLKCSSKINFFLETLLFKTVDSGFLNTYPLRFLPIIKYQNVHLYYFEFLNFEINISTRDENYQKFQLNRLRFVSVIPHLQINKNVRNSQNFKNTKTFSVESLGTRSRLQI